tara:strand:- start:17555 stop:18817 length:1263 start_codon:yes stop_codon:yes gene_type:complete
MFISNFFQSRGTSSNNPGTEWGNWASAMGSSSSAGTLVNKDTALALAALRGCVTLLAESVAQLPCELYRRTADGGRERATDHPLYDVIHSQPNRKDTAFEYYEQSQGALGLDGNHIALIDRDGAGYVRELIPVSNTKVRVLKGNDGMPYYHLLDQNDILPARMVHHIKGFSLDGFVGVSPIDTNADAIGLAIATEEHASAVFSRGTTMSGVIERPREASPITDQTKVDRLLSKFAERHSGVRNMFSIALLQEGMSYKQLAMDNEKAQLLESRKHSAVTVCQLYKVSPHMIQMMDKATFNNVEHMGLQYVTYALLPWLKRHESAMMRDLLLPSERGEYYIEFNVSGLLRGDQKSRYEAYAIGRNWGWLSADDVRRMENMPPIPGGDRYLTPLNMADPGNTAQALNASPSQMKDIEDILCRA